MLVGGPPEDVPFPQVLKIAILSEKFATEYAWYVDVVLNIISQAGDFVSDDVYHRVVQIVTNNEDVQKHAADLVFKVRGSGRRSPGEGGVQDPLTPSLSMLVGFLYDQNTHERCRAPQSETAGQVHMHTPLVHTPFP